MVIVNISGSVALSHEPVKNQGSLGGHKSMCLAAESGVAVAAAKLLLVRWESGYIH